MVSQVQESVFTWTSKNIYTSDGFVQFYNFVHEQTIPF